MDILFIWVVLASLVFLLKELYFGLRLAELRTPKAMYSRRDAPVVYWVGMFSLMGGIGFLLLLIAACVAVAFSYGMPPYS